MVAEPKTREQVDAFVSDLRKTRGGVQVSEADGEIAVRTRDGDDYRFKLKGAA